MIKLSFVCGSSLRKVVIDKRVISMMAKETGFIPITMDLDKMDSSSQKKKITKKLGKDSLKIMKEISLLNTEEEMAKDITKDFQSTGWRKIKQDGND